MVQCSSFWSHRPVYCKYNNNNKGNVFQNKKSIFRMPSYSHSSIIHKMPHLFWSNLLNTKQLEKCNYFVSQEMIFCIINISNITKKNLPKYKLRRDEFCLVLISILDLKPLKLLSEIVRKWKDKDSKYYILNNITKVT